MSALIMGRVYELDLPSNEQSLLMAMADHADHTGNNIFPSNGLIAWKLGMSYDTVLRLKRKLEARGVLVLVESKAGQTKKYRIDLAKGVPKAPYRLAFDTGEGVASCGGEGSHPAGGRILRGVAKLCGREGSQSYAGGGVAKLCDPNHQEPSIKPSNKKRVSKCAERVPDNLDTPEFKATWKDWLEDRKQRKISVTPLAAKLQLKNLSAWGLAKAIVAINTSIEKGWRGLFEPKNENFTTNRKDSRKSADRNEGTQNAGRAGEYDLATLQPENVV